MYGYKDIGRQSFNDPGTNGKVNQTTNMNATYLTAAV